MMSEMDGRTQLKICGVTNAADARLVAAAGADFCGILVNVAFSERSLSLERARDVAQASGLRNVVLLCNPTAEEAEKVVAAIQPYAVQLLCQESPEFVSLLKARLECPIWKAVHAPVLAGEPSPDAYIQAGVDALLVDNVDTSEGLTRFGGTGKLADWALAAEIVQASPVPVFLAGGINADNIARAIANVHPWGIDLCSGVEASIGKKDPEKLRALAENFHGVCF